MHVRSCYKLIEWLSTHKQESAHVPSREGVCVCRGRGRVFVCVRVPANVPVGARPREARTNAIYRGMCAFVVEHICGSMLNIMLLHNAFTQNYNDVCLRYNVH